MSRVILHCDMNNFYASVECLYHPELRDKPVAVGGDPDKRHGIVLAKNQIAKKFGVITGEALWQARQKCPDIIFLKPDFEKYLRFSEMGREILADYTDRVEPFGLDESWLDVSADTTAVHKDGKALADAIRERIRLELGITASIGVSYNKIFAKLGSDMKKPDATTVIGNDDFQSKVWPLPVSDLLYVGHATQRKLRQYRIFTIGDLANTSADTLRYMLGVNGVMLWQFANGMDTSPVSNIGAKSLIKSIGNSTTTPHDLTSELDVKVTLYMLAESVAARMREHGFLCRTVQLSVRDTKLYMIERQLKLPAPACVSTVLADAAYRLFRENVFPPYAIRSLGVRACDLALNENMQLSFLPEQAKTQKQEELEKAIDSIRQRFGHGCLQRGIMMQDRELSDLDPKDHHSIQSVSFLSFMR